METLKVALIDLNRKIGGGQFALLNMAFALQKRGHEVHVILGIKELPDRFSRDLFSEINYHFLPGFSTFEIAIDTLERTKHLLLELDKSIKFDAINSEALTGGVIPQTLQNRTAVTLHGNSMQRGLNLIQHSTWNHDMRASILKAPNNFARNILGHITSSVIERRSCQNARVLIVLTKTEASYARKNYGITFEKIRVLPNVVFMPEDEPTIALPEGKKIFLSVGTLDFVKGIPILAKAVEHILAHTVDTVYLSVGNGPLMGIIQDISSRFPGRVIILPRADKGLASLYSQSQLLIHGSIFEAFGMSIAESMRQSRSVVAFNLASIPDVVVNNVTGLLSQAINWRNLAEKALYLLEDEPRNRRMGLCAKKKIEELANPETVGKEAEKILKEVQSMES